MWLDIEDLQKFYNSPLGLMVNRVISRHIHASWPSVKNSTILGLGFPGPYLNIFHHETNNVFAAIPASGDATFYPKISPEQTFMTDEAELPLEDLSIDRVILIHSVEFSESIWPLMREIWRVLSNDGRLIIIAPNRRGVWARLERTPFGYGRPYSQSQLTTLLHDTLFTPIKIKTALYMPPIGSRMLISSSLAWEHIGRYFLDGLGLAMGGIISIEAKKQIYAITPNIKTSRSRSYVTILNQ